MRRELCPRQAPSVSAISYRPPSTRLSTNFFSSHLLVHRHQPTSTSFYLTILILIQSPTLRLLRAATIVWASHFKIVHRLGHSFLSLEISTKILSISSLNCQSSIVIVSLWSRFICLLTLSRDHFVPGLLCCWTSICLSYCKQTSLTRLGLFFETTLCALRSLPHH